MTIATDVRNDGWFLSQTLLAYSQVVVHLETQWGVSWERSVCLFFFIYSLNVSIHITDVCKSVPVSLNTNMKLVICKADSHISLMGCKTLILSTKLCFNAFLVALETAFYASIRDYFWLIGLLILSTKQTPMREWIKNLSLKLHKDAKIPSRKLIL